MNFGEYEKYLDELVGNIRSVTAKRDELALRLEKIVASDVPTRVKNARIRQVTREAVDLKREVLAAAEDAKRIM